jgi:hypothetical protein
VQFRNAKLLLLAATAFAGVLYAQDHEFVSGARIDFDDATGRTEVTKAHVTTEDGLQVSAGKATFVVDENEIPKVVELRSGVKFSQGGLSGTADTATLYPDLQMVVSSRLLIKEMRSGTSNVVVSYTCSGGALYGNGNHVEGNSVCVNSAGGGSNVIRCGGSGGNQVTMIHYRYSCAGG